MPLFYWWNLMRMRPIARSVMYVKHAWLRFWKSMAHMLLDDFLFVCLLFPWWMKIVLNRYQMYQIDRMRITNVWEKNSKNCRFPWKCHQFEVLVGIIWLKRVVFTAMQLWFCFFLSFIKRHYPIKSSWFFVRFLLLFKCKWYWYYKLILQYLFPLSLETYFLFCFGYKYEFLSSTMPTNIKWKKIC